MTSSLYQSIFLSSTWQHNRLPNWACLTINKPNANTKSLFLQFQNRENRRYLARGRGEREGGEKVQEKKERRAKIKKGKHGEKKKNRQWSVYSHHVLTCTDGEVFSINCNGLRVFTFVYVSGRFRSSVSSAEVWPCTRRKSFLFQILHNINILLKMSLMLFLF